jgi:hypothetical protein
MWHGVRFVGALLLMALGIASTLIGDDDGFSVHHPRLHMVFRVLLLVFALAAFVSITALIVIVAWRITA